MQVGWRTLTSVIRRKVELITDRSLRLMNICLNLKLIGILVVKGKIIPWTASDLQKATVSRCQAFGFAVFFCKWRQN